MNKGTHFIGQPMYGQLIKVHTNIHANEGVPSDIRKTLYMRFFLTWCICHRAVSWNTEFKS